ncbi:hypothetical protein Agub_g5655 [Astrephomene gubernaculifera]|uniref:Uncharacterized protein n=1 Tax=Astrephomene gubernaculifera TaxID=47775 RepID=A0AAD3DM72_9CHLO|nr:hypothetical protein Agub_g5655 [Astrephomene gubernaculifera]
MLQRHAPPCCCTRRQRIPCRERFLLSRNLPIVMSFKTSPERPQSPQRKNSRTPVVTDRSTNSFKQTVDVLLNRAASSLERGPCTCLSCRGGGTVECPHCKATGRLGEVAVERASLLRNAVRRFRMAVGLTPHEVPYATSEWVRTNRCPRCRGSGRLLCELCGGTGLRFPHLAQDHWRQCAGQPGEEGGGPDGEYEDACPTE